MDIPVYTGINMAVDGRKFKDTFSHGSDDYHDFSCSPCTKDGRNVAPIKYCVECDENLYTTCMKHHNKFAVMRGHQLLDKARTQSCQRSQLPSQRCDKHGGKISRLFM